VLTFVFGGLSLLGSFYRHSVIAALLGLITLQAAVLFWRRSQPVAVLLLSIVISVIAFAITPDREAGSPGLVFAVYAVSVYGPSRARLWVAVASITLVVAGVALLFLNDLETSRKLIPSGATSLVAWVVGDYVRSRRSFMQDLMARHSDEREQAAEGERLRIARELHDVVAHNVSAMAIQAGAARVAGSSDKEALASIEQGARDTLTELNKLLGVLRKSPDAPLTPQPTLQDVDTLLKPARDAGIEVTLRVTGETRALSAAVDLSAYRIVQEAITNVLKHANASRVEVVIDYEKEGIALTVSDNGNGPSEGPATGHGLIGMRERVALFGGKMGTGSSPLGGFTVHARLPYNN